MTTQFQPKGSLCANCTKKNDDCSQLPFSQMKPLEVIGNVRIVRCSEFERDKKTPF